VKTTPILPATIDFTHEAGVPYAPRFGDVYHPISGAFAQARHVFLGGNGLPDRWQGRERFAILETGFGLGNNFLATWQAWRDAGSPSRLTYVSLELQPPRREDLRRAHAESPVPAFAQALIDAWPPLVPGLHVLDFEGGRLRLMLGWGEATALARRLVGRFDALYLDGFAPARHPDLWTPELFKALARVCAPGTTAATWSAARAVRDGLASQGFTVAAAAGQGGKREMTCACFAPRFVPLAPPGRRLPTMAPTQALVIGGGLAGAATAAALARRGVAVEVLDRHGAPAAEASGNPAGLFHGTVAPDDGPHARCFRAAALRALPWLREALATGVPGAIDGAARVTIGSGVAALQATARAQLLDEAYVTAIDAATLADRAGLPTRHAAWWYPGGGWISPRALVTHWLATGGVRWRGDSPVDSIASCATGWRALDAAGRVLGEAPMLVLANAHDALRLAGLPAAWLQQRRGQLSLYDATQLAHTPPHCPIAGQGYVIGLADGGLLLGATSTADDEDDTVRDGDHEENLSRAEALCGTALVRPGARPRGRVGWRAVTGDRLPLAGFAPDPVAALPARRDAPRIVTRRAGLWLHTGLGSRGLTTAVLGADLIAAQACADPWPLEADLVDAIDPARCVLRDAQS